MIGERSTQFEGTGMSVDYTTIAIITIFTSFFSGLGQELAKYVIERLKKNREMLKIIARAR